MRPSFIWDCRHRQPRAAYPRRRNGPFRLRRGDAAWPCIPWGLPGRPGRPRRRWALTPPFHPWPVPRCRSHRLVCFLLHLPSSTGVEAFPLGSTVPCDVRTFLTPDSNPGRDGPVDTEMERPGRPLGARGVHILTRCRMRCGAAPHEARVNPRGRRTAAPDQAPISRMVSS